MPLLILLNYLQKQRQSGRSLVGVWRAAYEVPDESLNLAEIRRKQDAATAMADEMMSLPNSAWEDIGGAAREGDPLAISVENFIKSVTGSSKEKRAAIDAIEAEVGYRTTPQVAGAFDYVEPVIIGNRADDRIGQGARFFDETDDATNAQRRIDTSDELNELAEANLRSGQASKVQDALPRCTTFCPKQSRCRLQVLLTP